MSWPYTSCGNVQVNRDAVFAALLLVFDPHYPHLHCYSKKTITALDKNDTTSSHIKSLWLSSSSLKWGLAIVSSCVFAIPFPEQLLNARTRGTVCACGWKNHFFSILVVEGC